jgi:hypothetical protein
MVAGAFLPAASTTPVWLGTYVATNPYPNPIATGTIASFTVNGLTFDEEADPSINPPGDIGQLAYYPYLTGPFKDTAKSTISYSLVQESYDAYTAMYTSFNSAVSAYNTKKDEYNVELEKE